MSEVDNKNSIWFVYDGECPLCRSTAQALRIKKDYGPLNLVNARENTNHPLVQKINQQHLDLDEGMVIFLNDRFYHGKDALKFMVKYSDTKNILHIFCKIFFWSDRLSRLIYPWMRGVRNLLLRKRDIGRIDNLNLKNEPIFKSIFGASWECLPIAMKKHYANCPYTNDEVVVRGSLNVMCKPPLKWLGVVMRRMGQIPIHNEQNVPVTVSYTSDKNSKAFHFVRSFHFKGAAPYIFHSRMLQIKDNEVIEIMRFGLGWKMLYLWDGQKVVLQHRGYALYIFGHYIPMPLTYLMGKGYAEEIAVDENTFDMLTHITHPWWGKVYEYKGRFSISESSENVGL